MRANTCKALAGTMLLTVAMALNPRGSMGADIVWTNSAGGAWLVEGNWEPNQIPGALDTARMTNAFTSYTVQYNTTETAFRGTSAILHITIPCPVKRSRWK